MSIDTMQPARPGKALTIALWIAQLLSGFVFCSAGFMKLTTPIAKLSAMLPWTGQVPELLVRAIGLIDLAGGIGVLLPALTRIRPGLTVLAALCCAILQCCAAVFHAARGEFDVLPVNAALLALSLFIWWGRGRKAVIAAR